MVRNRRTLAAVTLAPMVVFGLAACGGGSSTATAGGSAGASTSAPTATGSRGAGVGGGGQNGVQFQKIQECLGAAGITLPTRGAGDGARPSGGTRPTDLPTDLPSGMPSGGPRPSGSFGGGAGGGGGFRQMFQDKNVQAALKACGLTLPTGRPSAAATS